MIIAILIALLLLMKHLKQKSIQYSNFVCTIHKMGMSDLQSHFPTEIPYGSEINKPPHALVHWCIFAKALANLYICKLFSTAFLMQLTSFKC